MFLEKPIQYKSVAEFEEYLNSMEKPNWVKTLVIHHTWKPVQSDWNGEKTMIGLQNYYKKLGWTAGPHMFVCVGSPNPANDGIWILSPLDSPGIHAGDCNSVSWGMEIVGNFDVMPWPATLKTFLYDLFPVLLKKLEAKSITLETMKGHRECNSPKTCPGKQINMDLVRSDVQQIMFPNKNLVTRNSSIISPPRCTLDESVKYLDERGWYTKNELQNIILKAYFVESEKVGVDPCVAIAQMVHETGYLSSWWSNRPRRNPAGIGVTGQTSSVQPKPEDLVNWAYNTSTQMWHKGLSYATFDKDAVPAHISRLLAYATVPIQRTSEQQRYIDTYTKSRPVPDRVNGIAPTLAGLEGTWAFPGKGYADKIASHANGIIRM